MDCRTRITDQSKLKNKYYIVAIFVSHFEMLKINYLFVA